jgi:hypothetical protein
VERRMLRRRNRWQRVVAAVVQHPRPEPDHRAGRVRHRSPWTATPWPRPPDRH